MSRASDLADRANQDAEEVIPHVDELLELMLNSTSEGPDASYALGKIAEKAPIFFLKDNRANQIKQGAEHEIPTVRQNSIGILNDIARVHPDSIAETIRPEVLRARLSESGLNDQSLRHEIRKNSVQLAFRISRVDSEAVITSLDTLMPLIEDDAPIDAYASVTIAELAKNHSETIAPKLPRITNQITDTRPTVSEFLTEIVGRCAHERPDMAEEFHQIFEALIDTNKDPLVINAIGTIAAFADVNPKAVAPLVDDVISLFEDTYSSDYPPMAKRNAAETIVVLSRNIQDDDIRLEQRIRELQQNTSDRTTARLLELSLNRISDQTDTDSRETVIDELAEIEELAESMIEGGPLVFAENIENLIRDNEIQDSNIANETRQYDR